MRATLDAQEHLKEDEEEDFQMVPLDDEHWTTEDSAWQKLYVYMNMPYCMDCAHAHANYLLPSYTNTMDLSDISDFEDIMITSSDEDIPALEDPPYWKDSGLHWTLYWL